MSDESSETGNRCMFQLVKQMPTSKVFILAFNAPTGADPGDFPTEIDLIILPYILYRPKQTV